MMMASAKLEVNQMNSLVEYVWKGAEKSDTWKW